MGKRTDTVEAAAFAEQRVLWAAQTSRLSSLAVYTISPFTPLRACAVWYCHRQHTVVVLFRRRRLRTKGVASGARARALR